MLDLDLGVKNEWDQREEEGDEGGETLAEIFVRGAIYLRLISPCLTIFRMSCKTHLFGSSKIGLCLGEVGIIAFGTLPFMDEAVHLALIALEVGLIKTLALVIQIRASQRHFTDEPFYHSAS